jgi:hypothetical protein
VCARPADANAERNGRRLIRARGRNGGPADRRCALDATVPWASFFGQTKSSSTSNNISRDKASPSKAVCVCLSVCARRALGRAVLCGWRRPRRAAGESQAKPHTSPSLSVTFVQYYMLDRMDSTSNAHSIETGAGDRGRESRPSGVALHEELTLAHRRGTQDTHRTGAGRTHRGSTAVGAQRGAAMHLPEKIGWQSSGAQLYPAPAAPAWDATQAQCSHHAPTQR